MARNIKKFVHFYQILFVGMTAWKFGSFKCKIYLNQNKIALIW